MDQPNTPPPTFQQAQPTLARLIRYFFFINVGLFIFFVIMVLYYHSECWQPGFSAASQYTWLVLLIVGAVEFFAVLALKIGHVGARLQQTGRYAAMPAIQVVMILIVWFEYTFLFPPASCLLI